MPEQPLDERFLDSGLEVKPLYRAADAPPVEAPPAGAFPFTRGPYPDMYRGRPWTIRQYAGFASAEESNERYRYLLARGQTGLSIAFDLPTQLGFDSDDAMAEGEVGRTGVAVDSIADMEVLLNGIPLDEVSTSMTINAPAALLLLLYELVAEPAGRAELGAAWHGAERHPQGVRGARELHLPAATVDAADDRSVRVLRGAHPPLEHDLDLRLPHPRGGLDRRPGARLHARERDRLLRGGRRSGSLPRCLRREALVLLQRSQRLLPGGREVPGSPHVVGTDHARPVRRHHRAGTGAALPRADRRLDPHRPATREQHRQSCRAGTLGRLWRRAIAPHEQLRRGARTPERARRDDRAAHAAGSDARGGHHRHGRSARRLLLHRGAHRGSRSSARPS